MEEFERGLSVVGGGKENVMKDLSIQETLMTRMVEADLRGGNGEASHVDQKIKSSSADRSTSSSSNRTYLNTAA